MGCFRIGGDGSPKGTYLLLLLFVGAEVFDLSLPFDELPANAAPPFLFLYKVACAKGRDLCGSFTK